MRDWVVLKIPIATHAALLAEHVAGAHGEAAHDEPQPMDLGAMQNSGMGVAYHEAKQANGTCTGHGQGGQNGQQLCHYCKQPGHFMLSCKKLKHDMQMK